MQKSRYGKKNLLESSCSKNPTDETTHICMNIITSVNEQINNDNSPESEEFTTGFDFAGFFEKIRPTVPYIIAEDGSSRYILLTELPYDLEQWIITGETEKTAFATLSDEEEKKLKIECRSLGFTVTRGYQSMEYAGHVAEIKTLRIGEPNSRRSVVIIPWFMIPRKRLPSFVYIYAFWRRQYYNKSVRETAKTTSTLFGVDMHYSTVSRSMKMAQALDGVTEPVQAMTDGVSFDNILDAIPGILAANKDEQAEMAGNGQAEALLKTASSFADIIRTKARKKAKRPPPTSTRRRRRKQMDSCTEGKPPKEKPILIVSRKELNAIRQQFIIECQRLIINVAKQHHKFLL